MVACSAPKGYRVMDQNVEGCWLRREHLMQKQEGKQQYWRDKKTGLASAHCLSLGCFQELGELLYLIWKRTSKAIWWFMNLDIWSTDRYFMTIIWDALGSVIDAIHFGLSLCNPLEHNKLPYCKWKRTFIAFVWGIVPWSTSRVYIKIN